jgi:hypothetical protein
VFLALARRAFVRLGRQRLAVGSGWLKHLILHTT